MSKNDVFGTEPQQPQMMTSIVTLAGDANGPSNANTVTAVQNVPYSTTPPTVVGQVPIWNGTQMVPGTPPSGPVLDTGLTIYPNPNLGELVYLSSNRTVSKAIATSSGSAKIWGVYLSPGTVVTEGVCQVLLEPGLTLTPNDVIYVSPTTAARGTNIKPGMPNATAPIGFLGNTGGYDVVLGSVVNVNFHKEPIYFGP